MKVTNAAKFDFFEFRAMLEAAMESGCKTVADFWKWYALQK